MPTKSYEPRTYRTRMARPGLVGFQVAVKETDLWVLAGQDLSREVREVVLQERRQLEAYIAGHPEFLTTLTPWPEDPFAPPVVREMISGGPEGRGRPHGRGGRGPGGTGGPGPGAFERRGDRGKRRRYLPEGGHCRPPCPCLPANPP